MKAAIRASLLLTALLTASAAQAACSVSADQGAAARTIDATVQADADLVVAMSMVPTLTHLDYHAATQRPDCDLGPLVAGSATYELWGSDAAGRQRKALPARKGDPVALLIPIFDIMKAIDSAKTGKSAPIEGYLLATVTKTDLTGWRFYTAVPEVTLLKHDMADALAGTGAPIFRNGVDGKTSLFVPKGG